MADEKYEEQLAEEALPVEEGAEEAQAAEETAEKKPKNLKELIQYIKTHENLRQVVLFTLFSMICGVTQMLITLLLPIILKAASPDKMNAAFGWIAMGNGKYFFDFTDEGQGLGSFLGWLIGPEDLTFTDEELQEVSKEDIVNALSTKAGEIYQAKEEEYGSEIMRELERVILLKVVDTKWMAHIDDMEELKKGIGLRSYGQKNPVIEYRYEGFEMFDAMVESIREDTIRMLLTVKLQTNEAPEREQVAQPDAPNAGAGDGSFSDEPVRSKKIGDNDPCPCGSGKKYKKCCKAKDMANK